MSQVEENGTKPVFAIVGDWLVQEADQCTCSGGGPECNAAHEPGCGYEPIQRVEVLLDRNMKLERFIEELRGTCRETPYGEFGDYGPPVVFANDILEGIDHHLGESNE